MVNKSDIHAELSGERFTPKHNEITIVSDAICPTLLEKLENDQLKAIYPYHGILVYNINNKKPEGFMQSCTLFKQVKSHISHFLMRSMGAAILERLSLILQNSL